LTTDAPTGCDYPLGAFDKDRAKLVIVCESADVFEFDGARWTKFTTLTTEPPARRFASMVYDEQNKRVVLFGGFNGIEYLDDTWLWNGTTWTEAEDGDQPPGRSLGMLFWDPVRDRVTLYGGIGRPNTEDAIVRYNDQWTFDGTRWTEAASLTTPPARYGSYVEYDPQRERVVMFGGKNEREQYINEHWEWDGTSWQQIDSTGKPSPRMNGMLAFDPQRQAFTLFGGYAAAYFDEVWTLKDNHWQLQLDVLPERRRPVGTGN
jgi:N-acetylneuraminic acid mutarotase